MKRKNIYTLMCIAGLLTATSCSDYLETSSPSVVDGDFVFSNSVTARAAMDGAYEQWRDCAQNKVFGDGLFYGADICGSDIERHPEPFSNQLGRHYPEGLYQNGKYTKDYGLLSYLKEDDVYASLYSVVGKANAVTNAMESASNFGDIVTNATKPSALSQMYGEAISIRATAYRELIKNFGDVPYNEVFGKVAVGLVSRDSIYDVCIEQLKKVEPLMYEVGSIPGIAAANKNYFSRTYVKGLIGRMALEAGGYQTRRTDLGSDFYKDGKGNVLTFEKKGTDQNSAFYGRRNDWKELYKIAQTYYKSGIDQSGTAKLYLTDPRAPEKGRIYDNPYQYFFEQMHDTDNNRYADESIYEYPMQQGGGNDGRSYSFGRVSSGGTKDAYPCKAYGQGRINPAFYYGLFDPQDKRRDVSVCVTGSTGAGVEKLIPFTPNSKAEGGGLTLNKWDENRQENPWVGSQRKSGINGPYMRIAEFYLGYAEACAALGEDGPARQYLKVIRERSFPTGKAETDKFITVTCGGDILKAVIEERGFEYAGEGDRRWTLIRSGYLPDAIKRVKELTRKMLDGLAGKGYYTFENGNIISSYVWTKLVDAKTQYGHRLTTQCPAGKEDDAVLSPGWRGQKDNWEEKGLKYGTTTPKTNLAIKGLFKYIEPGSAEALALESDGYIKVAWGADLVKNDDEFYKYLFYDYDYVSAPIYLWPFTPNVMSAGGFTNGYGFKQE